MDLRESMWDSVKVFCEGLRVQLAATLSWYTVFLDLLTFIFITEVLLLTSDIESLIYL